MAEKSDFGSKVSFQLGDALNLPFKDGEFDVAIGQAILILVDDKIQAVKEALRVVKVGGYVRWLELSWNRPTTKEFLEGVSNVICAYCMLGVETFKDWERLFQDTGVRQLQVFAYSQKFTGFRSMLADEGLLNAGKIFFKYLTNPRIRTRMRIIERFFRENSEYFGYGIYVGRK